MKIEMMRNTESIDLEYGVCGNAINYQLGA